MSPILKNSGFLPYHLSLLAQHSSQGIVAYDCNLKVLSWNPAAEKMFGIKANKVMGTNLLDSISEASQIAKDLEFLKSVSSSEPRTQDKVLRKNGDNRWFPSHSLAYANFDEKGKVIGGTLLISDLSTTEYLHEIISEVEDLGQIVGWQYFPQDQALTISAGAQEVLGEDVSTWTNLSDLTHYFNLDSRAAFQDAVDEALKSGSHAQLELQDYRNEKHFKISFKTESAHNQVVRIFGVCQDITADVANKNLIDRQEMQLISRSRLAAVGELAAGVAHEINNPLAIVSGCAELFFNKAKSKTVGDKDIQILVPKIENGLERIRSIVSGLLKFSRSGDSSRGYEKSSLHDVIDDTVSFIGADFANSGIEVVKTYNTTDSEILCSVTELGQVILNIIKNARDFFLEAEVEERQILIETRRSSDDWLILTIENTGPKIDERIADNIFEPFFTTKEVGKGTGLGMSVSYNIIEEHSGKIYLDMNRRRTTFVIEFPPLDSEHEGAA